MMEPIMNRLSQRFILVAALLSFFKVVSAFDGHRNIEANPNHPVEVQNPPSIVETGTEVVIRRDERLMLESSRYTVAQTQSRSMPMDRELIDLSLPIRGMSKKTVIERFGKPLSIHPAVGKPPISRWIYDNYTVYFEFGRVIHSVLN